MNVAVQGKLFLITRGLHEKGQRHFQTHKRFQKEP